MTEGRRRRGVVGLAWVGLVIGCSCDPGPPNIDATAIDALGPTTDVPFLDNCGPPETSFEDGAYPASARETPWMPLGPRPEGDRIGVVGRIAGHQTQDTGMYWLIGDEAPELVVEAVLGLDYLPLDEHWSLVLYVDGVPVPIDGDATPLARSVEFDAEGRAVARVPLTTSIVSDGAHTLHYFLATPRGGNGSFGLTVYRNSHTWSVWADTAGALRGEVVSNPVELAVLASGRPASGYIAPEGGRFELTLGGQPISEDVLSCPSRPERFAIVALLDGYPLAYGSDPRGALFGETLGAQRAYWGGIVIDELPDDGLAHRLLFVKLSGLSIPNEENLGSGVWTPGTYGGINVGVLMWPVPS